MSFLHLPIEIRLAIYEELFGRAVAFIDGGRQDTGMESQGPSMLPAITSGTPVQHRAAQLLRTCKTILAEARPVLYQNTIFRSHFQAFAGRLPVHMSTGLVSGPEVRHIDWRLNCDLLKKYDPADVKITPSDIPSLQSVQLTCQVENWREPMCGEWCDRDTFTRGRQQLVDFAKLLQANMTPAAGRVTLVEDVTALPRGRVMLKIFQGRKALTANVRTWKPRSEGES